MNHTDQERTDGITVDYLVNAQKEDALPRIVRAGHRAFRARQCAFNIAISWAAVRKRA